jgi:hypothetical protein
VSIFSSFVDELSKISMSRVVRQGGGGTAGEVMRVSPTKGKKAARDIRRGMESRDIMSTIRAGKKAKGVHRAGLEAAARGARVRKRLPLPG